MTFGHHNKVTDQQWQRLSDSNSVHLRRFFCNVDTLSVSRFGSRSKAIIALRERTGISTRSQTVKSFKDGEYTDSRLIVLQGWCLLFGVDLVAMLSEDYSKTGK